MCILITTVEGVDRLFGVSWMSSNYDRISSANTRMSPRLPSSPCSARTWASGTLRLHRGAAASPAGAKVFAQRVILGELAPPRKRNSPWDFQVCLSASLAGGYGDLEFGEEFAPPPSRSVGTPRRTPSDDAWPAGRISSHTALPLMPVNPNSWITFVMHESPCHDISQPS
jgi:hypothetical protein